MGLGVQIPHPRGIQKLIPHPHGGGDPIPHGVPMGGGGGVQTLIVVLVPEFHQLYNFTEFLQKRPKTKWKKGAKKTKKGIILTFHL